MKRFIGVIFISISVMVMSGCIFDIFKDASQSDPVIAKSENAPFQVEIPDGWEIAEPGELNEEADLEVMNEDESMYFIAIMEDKRDLDVDLESYRDLIVQMNEESYEASFNESVATKVGEYDAYLNEFEITEDNLKYHIWLFSFETDHYFGQLFTWTLVSQSEENEAEILDIVNSFEEVPEDTTE